MKNSIKIIQALLLLALAFTTNAKDYGEIIDEIVVPLSSPNEKGLLRSKQIYGGITVTGYGGKEVIIKVFQKKKHYKIENKHGLKMIPNSSFNLEVEERDNTVYIKSKPHGGNSPVNLEIQVPHHFNLKLENINNGDTLVNNVSGELEISNINGSIALESISGSVTADTINGKLAASFKQVTKDADMAFSCLNHDIDISLPKGTGANIKAKTLKGNIYTGFEMEILESRMERENAYKKGRKQYGFEQWVKGKINGGGPVYSFSSLNGDIIIREKD